MESTFSFRLDEVTRQRLLTLSKKSYESRGSILRRLITREYFERGCDSPESDGLSELSLLVRGHPNVRELLTLSEEGN